MFLLKYDGFPFCFRRVLCAYLSGIFNSKTTEIIFIRFDRYILTLNTISIFVGCLSSAVNLHDCFFSIG